MKLGRKPKFTPHKQRDVVRRRDSGEETLAEIGRSYNVSSWTIARLTGRWLRVSGTAEMPHIDQCVGHQFHTVVALLFELEAQQQPLEFIFPREGSLHA